MRLAAGMEHRPFATPDAAICSILVSPLDCKGIDYGHVSSGASGPWQMEARLDRDAKVRAILGTFTVERRMVLVGWALRLSRKEIAAAVGVTERTVRRWHTQDRERLITRLQDLGLMEASGT